MIDRTSPQAGQFAVNGLDERRRGLIFGAALRQVMQAGKLPPAVIINRDLSIPATVPDEPRLPAGQTLLRIYLTQWSQTALGGIADTEILCRFYAEILRDGQVRKKLGPFFARGTYDLVLGSPTSRWSQYQRVAQTALEKMGAALSRQNALAN